MTSPAVYLVALLISLAVLAYVLYLQWDQKRQLSKHYCMAKLMVKRIPKDSATRRRLEAAIATFEKGWKVRPCCLACNGPLHPAAHVLMRNPTARCGLTAALALNTAAYTQHIMPNTACPCTTPSPPCADPEIRRALCLPGVLCQGGGD